MRYQSVIKINLDDSPGRQADDIADGIGYAVALLMDEYDWSAGDVERVLERATDDAYDLESSRR